MKLSIALLVTCSISGLARAGEGDAPTEATASTEAAAPTEAPARELAFRGFVSFAGQHNFTYPGRGADVSGVRAFDHQYDTLSLDVAQLSAQLPAAVGQGGFRIDLNAGYSIPRRTGSTGSFSSLGLTDVDLLQAYGSFIFDVGRGLRLDAGKFVTHLGAEVIEGVDGFNFNYSRSMLFFNAIPFTHTGLKLSYSFSDMVSAMVMVANGADVVLDNNTSKAVGGQVVVTPNDKVALYANYLLSANNDNDNEDRRHYVDLVANLKPTKELTLNVNFDWTKDPKGHIGGPDRTQTGVAGIVAYAFTDMVSLAVRGEYWDSGIDANLDGKNEKYVGVTVTPTLAVGENFAIRPEVRYDSAGSQKLGWVANKAKTASSQVTAALNIVAWY